MIVTELEDTPMESIKALLSPIIAPSVRRAVFASVGVGVLVLNGKLNLGITDAQAALVAGLISTYILQSMHRQTKLDVTKVKTAMDLANGAK